jgi:hypothetical protein
MTLKSNSPAGHSTILLCIKLLFPIKLDRGIDRKADALASRLRMRRTWNIVVWDFEILSAIKLCYCSDGISTQTSSTKTSNTLMPCHDVCPSFLIDNDDENFVEVMFRADSLKKWLIWHTIIRVRTTSWLLPCFFMVGGMVHRPPCFFIPEFLYSLLRHAVKFSKYGAEEIQKTLEYHVVYDDLKSNVK